MACLPCNYTDDASSVSRTLANCLPRVPSPRDSASKVLHFLLNSFSSFISLSLPLSLSSSLPLVQLDQQDGAPIKYRPITRPPAPAWRPIRRAHTTTRPLPVCLYVRTATDDYFQIVRRQMVISARKLVSLDVLCSASWASEGIFLLNISYLYCYLLGYTLYIYYSIVFILMLLVFLSNLWHKNFLQDE